MEANRVQIKLMLKSINLLNLILISVILFFASYIIFPMLTMQVAYKPPALKQSGEEKKEENPAQTQIPTAFEYTLIAEQNIFHPERKIPEKKDEEKAKPEFVLYGTLITDDIKVAYMEDKKAPHNTPGRGKRQSALHLGNTLSGFTLKEVQEDMVVMVRGDDKIEVKLLDPANTKIRDKGATLAKETEKSTPATASSKKPVVEVSRAKEKQDKESKQQQKREKSGNR
jgi:type II secretory pathway component PulC